MKSKKVKDAPKGKKKSIDRNKPIKADSKSIKKQMKSIQSLMPIKDVLEDGIFDVGDNRYSKMFAFDDSNFALESEQKQDTALDHYSSLLNKFPPYITTELVLVNRKVTDEKLADNYHFKKKLKEGMEVFDEYIDDYNAVIDKKLAEGRNNIRKERYFVMTNYANDFESARSEFNTYNKEVFEAFKLLNGSGARALTDLERLNLIASINRGVSGVPFEKEYADYFDSNGNLKRIKNKKNGNTVKDMVCPRMFEMVSHKGNQSIRLGTDRLARTFVLTEFPSFLDTRFLTAISSLPCELIVNVLFCTSPRKDTIHKLKNQNSSLQGEMIKRSKEASQAGYDVKYSARELEQMAEEAEDLRRDVADGKKIFYTTVTVTLFGETEEDLNEYTELLSGKCGDFLITPNPLFGQQRRGWQSAQLTGVKYFREDRLLTSDSVCALFPFNVQELIDKGGSFYGNHFDSKSAIVCDREKLASPHGFVFGKTGSGKSFIVKLAEIIPLILSGDEKIIILDPDGEYVPIAQTFGGTVLDISKKADFFLNPCDLDMEWDETKIDPVDEQCDYMVSLVEAMLGKNRECSAQEVTAIHRATKRMYEPYVKYMTELHENGGTASIDKSKCPTLEDFYSELQNDKTRVASDLAEAIEPFCIGAYSLFSHKTNVNTNARILVYCLKDVPTKMKELAMKTCSHQIWTTAIENREGERKNFRVYIDEFHLLCNTPKSAITMNEYWKRIRKYGGIMTGITQDINDLTKTEEGLGILMNSDFFLVMRQSPLGIQMSEKTLEISQSLMKYIGMKDTGCGILMMKSGATQIPFDFEYPDDSKLFKLASTKVSDV